MLVNIERMRRDIDELLGEVWAPSASAARGSDFQPRADVYYCESGETGRPTAVVVADLAGVADDAVNIEVSGRVLLISGRRPVWRTEGRAYQQVEIPTESTYLWLGPDGSTWIAAEEDGLVRVGRFDGGAAHVLAGHEGPVGSVAISPDQRWVASSGDDKTLRLWPMPDLSKRPLHTLPHQELIAKLKTLTNLRAVRDEESSTGWKIEVGPFPGWADVPEW